MAEVEERLHGKEGVEVETCDFVSGVKKCFRGVDKRGNKWRARASNPLLRTRVHLGLYETPEEAALVVEKKMAEFEEMLKGQGSSSVGTCRGYFEGTKLPGGVGKNKRAEVEEIFKGLDSSSMGICSGDLEGKKFHGKEGVEVDTRDDISGVKKRFLGVQKKGNKWRARTKNPLLRADSHLGYYKTPEEAALAVKKKKAEFKEMFKEQESSSMGICRGYFAGKKLPEGVRRDNGRYRVHIRHPKLKIRVSCGSYRTFEEAAIVADKKREEFREMYGENVWKRRVMSRDANVPPGVRRICSGKWVARIKKPESKDRIWLGTYNTLEEAISSYNKKNAEFDAKQNKSEFDSAEFSSGSEISESQMRLDNNSSYDYEVVDIPGKLGDGLVLGSPPFYDTKKINTASVGDKTLYSEFDRAVSLGIINEYGQLLGKYSELDTPTWLSSTDEYVTDCTENLVI